MKMTNVLRTTLLEATAHEARESEWLDEDFVRIAAAIVAVPEDKELELRPAFDAGELEELEMTPDEIVALAAEYHGLAHLA